jgi:hypothetical protein
MEGENLNQPFLADTPEGHNYQLNGSLDHNDETPVKFSLDEKKADNS